MSATAYADTGFVVSLYKVELTTGRAVEVMRDLEAPVLLSPLVELELRNALQLAVFRGELGREAAALKWILFREDVERGVFSVNPLPQKTWFDRAGELSGKHSALAGSRSLDLLHVAATLLLGAQTLLTFDLRQRRVGALEGLQVLPVQI